MVHNLPSILLCFPIIIIIIINLLCGFASSQVPTNYICSNSSTYAENSQFQKNLHTLLETLAWNSSALRFLDASTGNAPDTVYAHSMCLEYITMDSCYNCITKAQLDIVSSCPGAKDAVIWLELCQVRYSNQKFFGKLNVTGNIPIPGTKNISDPDKYVPVVKNLMRDLAQQAANATQMYASGEAAYQDKTIYAFLQCTYDLSRNDCNICLDAAIDDLLRKYYYLASARILSLSCFLRYEYDQFSAFYNQGSEVFPPSTSPTITQVKGSKSKTKLIAILASCVGGLAILLLGSCIYLILRRRNHQKGFEGTIEPKAEGYPNIRLETIHAATNNFSDTNKLGEGGFGPVYKGIMNDGKVVAIKRLSRFSDQSAEEFANEVQLIMQLQHKNLVTLLGFCADADEKLLVYEYMANSSLDVILFDDHKRAKLYWSRRVNIISGIAKGILYLHEDSRLRIIHRDLKASNVLLDNDMNPKISDFGMARIFAGSEGQAKTATLVGTIGYMAPEYAMDGLYSVKSDVFGFGVLLLEIITGRRNADTQLPAPSLLAYAWQLWNEEKALKLIDPLLHDSCDPVEFLRYLHIGLLCVQEIADDRPTMSCVVLMLNSESVTLSQPEKPAYSIGTFTDLNETSTDDSSINGLTVSVVSSR